MKNNRNSGSRRRKTRTKTGGVSTIESTSGLGRSTNRADGEHAECRRLLAQRQFAAARKSLKRLVAVAPAAGNFSLLSLAELGLGDIQAATAAVDQGIRHGLENASDLVGFAIAVFQEGDWSTSQHAFQLAARVQPANFEIQLNLAMAAHRNEQLEVAVAAYDAALEMQPTHFHALYNRGVALKRLQRWERATHSLEQAFGQQPQNVDVLCNLGQVAHQTGQLVAATHWFHLAVQNDPSNADAFHYLGNICLAQEQYDAAVGYYQQAMQLVNPAAPDLLNNLGAALVKLDRGNEAQLCFEQVLARQPQHGPAAENLGDLLVRKGDLVAALAHFETAIENNRSNVGAFVKKGRALRRLRRPQDSCDAFEQALRLQADCTDALSEMGVATFHRGSHQTSHDYFDRAIAADPSEPLFHYLKASALPVIHNDDDHIDQAREKASGILAQMEHDGLQLDPRRHAPNTFFYLAYQGRNDRELQAAAARVWKPTEVCDPRPQSAGRRLRVGFLTRYLTDHTVGMLTGGLIASLDRERFEALTFAFDNNHPWFRSNCDQFHVAPQQPGALIEYVARQQLDVLIFPEIGMDALTNAVARARMAPVQCAMWGHPVTTGIPTIDYFLSSDLLEPDEADDHYSEKLVRLETLPAYYYRPQPEEGLKTRSQLGLPEGKPLFACPQSLFKFHPEFDSVLDAVLERAPQSHLVLIEGGEANWTRLLQQRMAKTMKHQARIIWLPRLSGKDFFSLLSRADVVLDPMHFGGGRSNYLTMSAGTPLVTLPAEFMRGRVASAMYKILDYDECVVDSPEEYVQRAVELAVDGDYRRTVGKEIQARSDMLFENHRAITALEQFLESVAREGITSDAAI